MEQLWCHSAYFNNALIAGVCWFGNDQAYEPARLVGDDASGIAVALPNNTRVVLAVRDPTSATDLLDAFTGNLVAYYWSSAVSGLQLRRRTLTNVVWVSHSQAQVMEPGASGVTPVVLVHGVIDGGDDPDTPNVVDEVAPT